VGPELTTKIVLPDEVKAKRGRPRKSEVA
jgi:hypothetical protein